MSGADGKDDLLLNVTDPHLDKILQLMKRRRAARELLSSQQLPTENCVPLNDVLVSKMKQLLPIFRAIDLSSLNKRFAKTAIEKPTVGLELWTDTDNKKMMDVTLRDERKCVPGPYKKRSLTVPIKAFARILANITCMGIIRSLDIDDRDSLLELALKAEKLTPSRVEFWEFCGREEYLVRLAKRLANTGKVKVAQFHFGPNRSYDQRIDWQQIEQCLSCFTTLQRLQLRIPLNLPQPPLDLLKKTVLANGQLKRLEFDEVLFINYNLVCNAIPTIASVGGIFMEMSAGMVLKHVEEDLCGSGQCTLTKLVMNLPATGRLALDIFGDEDDFYGDMLRMCHYLLSLHRTGKTVVVEAFIFPTERMQEAVADLSHYYFPQMETKTGADSGRNYRYRLRVGTVSIYLNDL